MAVSSSPGPLEHTSGLEISPLENSTPPLEEKQNVVLSEKANWNGDDNTSSVAPSPSRTQRYANSIRSFFTLATLHRTWGVIWKFAMFTGPGVIISVAFIDPDNYQTAVASGAQFQYSLLFMILFSNAIAVYLQALSAKLGCVTGMDLAQMNRAYLPRWLNLGLYMLAEAAIICTDISQVIGTAIALNILNPNIPLIAGCAISISDTLFILMFYRPDGSIRRLRAFELFVAVFVIAVFVMFCIELSYITAPVGTVLDGFVPSRAIFVGQGLYQSCAIIGGTLQPHTIYLGSGLVQARMREFDRENDKYHEARASRSKFAMMLYRPTLSAIKSCMSYTIAELCITLLTIAIFVNSAILIIGAAELSVDDADADIPGMHQLFVSTIGQAAGTMFAISLLLSGISAGVVATMAGQLICEGAMNWRMSPYLRRFVTRFISIIPAIIIAAAEGQEGLDAALIGCNVVLSVALIFLTFPVLWYTSFNKYMRVRANDSDIPLGVVDGVLNYDTERALARSGQDVEGTVSLANNWATSIGAWLIWVLIAAMNVATLAFLGLGIGGN